MRSTRLPGKVLADICGQPMLAHVITRVLRAKLVNEVLVVTSDEATDKSVFDFCANRKVACFRGSESDVLDRFYQAVKTSPPDAIVRITADCPLIDAKIIDKVIDAYVEGHADYASNTLKPGCPDGLDIEVFSFSSLQVAWREAAKASEREHVTPYIRGSGKFRVLGVESGLCGAASGERWTVDEPEDLEFVRAVYEAFAGRTDFDACAVLDLLNRQPQIRQRQGKAMMNEGYYKSLYEQAVAGAAPPRPIGQSQIWFARSQKVIPGCAQTFSKGFTQHIQGVSPIFLKRGKGCRVWDVDGNEYIDYIQGLLPNILGYANDEVNAAAAAQYAEGHSFSLPHPIEVELAERLTRLIPCAEMVRFGKNGSDATSGAVRAARAFTGRDRVACCGYHGWQDWFIGSTTRNKGVPGAVCALTHSFPYNDLAGLEKTLSKHAGEFAAVIMEPVNFVEPAAGYLEGVKELAKRHGALLIFDEICTGFRFGLGGAQKRYGVTPDLACFGKAMGNGFPVACVLGRADVMREFEEIFFSFTLGGEVASLAAAMKVIDLLEKTDALADMQFNGRCLQDGFNALAGRAGLTDRFACVGQPVWSLLKFRESGGKDGLLERSLFQQETVKRGVLVMTTHNMSATHDRTSIEQTLDIYAAVFKTLAGWLSDPDPARFLEGPMIQPIFRVR